MIRSCAWVQVETVYTSGVASNQILWKVCSCRHPEAQHWHVLNTLPESVGGIIGNSESN